MSHDTNTEWQVRCLLGCRYTVELWEVGRSRGKWNNQERDAVHVQSNWISALSIPKEKKNPQSVLLWVELILEEGRGWRRKGMKSGAVKSFTWRLQAALLWKCSRKKKSTDKRKNKKGLKAFLPDDDIFTSLPTGVSRSSVAPFSTAICLLCDNKTEDLLSLHPGLYFKAALPCVLDWVT